MAIAATEKDIPEIRARLEALGYRGIQFDDSYGFIRGIAVVRGGKLKAVKLSLIDDLTTVDFELSDTERETLRREASVDGWVAGVKRLMPLTEA